MNLTGQRIGNHVLESHLGSGAMGEVYLAHHEELDRKVALKFLGESLCADPAARARFLAEARAAAGLQHPGIVAVHEVGEHEGRPFFTMAFVRGGVLDPAAVARGGIDELLEVAVRLTEALAAAHDAGVIHRDLKPGNILVGEDGSVRIADFGLAVVRQTALPADQAVTVDQLTQAGAVSGTVPYMAPEQLGGAPATPAMDVFALGVILHELATGEHPFQADSSAALIARILRDDPPPLQEVRAEVPYDLARIVRRCLHKDPLRRFQSAREMLGELLDLRETRAAGAGPDAAPPTSGGLRERRFPLTVEVVRGLSKPAPRLVGDEMLFLDNGVLSDTLVVYLHAWGLDHRWGADFLRDLPYRGVAPTLCGFQENARQRIPLSIADHAVLLRRVLQSVHQEVRPRRVVLMGFSSGADQTLHMVCSPEGAGIPVDALLPVGPNTSFASCGISSRFAAIKSGSPEEFLDFLRDISAGADTLDTWLIMHSYLVSILGKFRTDVDALRQYATEIMTPFQERGWRPFADWYRGARAAVPVVRFVVDKDDAPAIETILAHHLTDNVLGDDFDETTLVQEPVGHLELALPERLRTHVEAVLERLPD